MLEIYKTNLETNAFTKVDKIEKGCWVNLVNPTKEEILRLHDEAGIEDIFSTYLFDSEERPRIDEEDDQILIVVDVPIIEEEEGEISYLTMPLSMLVIRDDIFVTSSQQPLAIIQSFAEEKVKSFFTYKKTRFILQLLYKNASQYLEYIKLISKEVDRLEDDLQKSLKNSEIMKMLSVEKSLVYFTTSLKSNEIVMERLLRGKIIKLYEEDEDILEDSIIENKQAIEMTRIHSDILNSTMDTYSSLISNNLNNVMKFLTSITIVLSLPTIIGGIFGMNVALPYSPTDPLAFWYILGICGVVCVGAYALLKKKNLL